jgi:uncharacterized membrane protein YphA (DoxX/SURF4 family)
MALRILHWLSRLVLGGLFIYSGYIKIQDTLQFAVAVSGYKLVPEDLVFSIATYFPWVEIALGIVLLIGWKIRYSSAAAVALILFFIAILTITYLRGIEANCGCFSFDDRISPKTIVRDGLILIPALCLLVEPFLRRRLQRRVPVSADPAS